MSKKVKKPANGKLPGWAIAIIIIFSAVGVAIYVAFFAFTLYWMQFGNHEWSDFVHPFYLEEGAKGSYDEETDTYLITGYVTNNKTSTSDVYIAFTLFDADRNVVGYASDYAEELDSDETWKYTATYTGADAKNVKSFELRHID